MAEHFLARSQSYRKFCDRLPGKAFIRRKAICEYMTPEYKLDLSNGTENEIFNEIARDKYKPEKIAQNFQTFREDCALLRHLYCWLTGNAVEKTQLEQ